MMQRILVRRSRALLNSREHVFGGCASRVQARRLHSDTAGTLSGTLPETKQSLLSLLEERGYIKDIAGDRKTLEKLLGSRSIGAYAGIDPTAPSLHLGHLLPFMVLFWMYIHGHKAVSLVGGATAQIGDPTGRLISREAMNTNTSTTNLTAMQTRVKSLWKTVEDYAQVHGYKKDDSWNKVIENNASWLNSLSIIDFLRDAGTAARMGAMLSRDTVKNKMATGDGMSYAEFTYPLLQAWDWWHMYQSGVQIQIGGSDQYGNIVAGIDLIKHMSTKQSLPADQNTKLPSTGPFGITVPLLTTSAGVKFGKSAGNAIWLDKTMTSPFELYGFLLRSSDADVERYLKLFTFLPLPQISQVMSQHTSNPGQRKAQHLLARQVVHLVHGAEEAQRTQDQHGFSRNPDLKTLRAGDSTDGTPTLGMERVVLAHGLCKSPAHVLYHAGLAKSVGAATRMIESGGAYIGTEDVDGGHGVVFKPIKSVESSVMSNMVDERSVLVLRAGKWKVKLVEVVG